MVLAEVLSVVIPAVVGSVGGQSLQARGGPFDTAVRFPQVQPGDILRIALDLQALSERGLQPVLSIDPFTGNQVISTEDQSGILETLLGEKFAREALAPTPEEIREVFDLQQEAIARGRAGTLFPSPVAVPPPSTRDQVVASLVTSTARQVAPGVVARRSSDLAVGGRIAGPCAAANTGFSRLNCARGGFS